MVCSFNPTLLESFKTELMQQEVQGILHDAEGSLGITSDGMNQ